MTSRLKPLPQVLIKPAVAAKAAPKVLIDDSAFGSEKAYS
jgi:hypothetical protein